MTELSLLVGHSVEYGQAKLSLDTKVGKSHLRASLDLESKDFKINHIKVSTPRVGLGKELLRQARNEAIQMKASRITATIVSRECLASMTEVFGADNISVDKLGEFGIRYSTVAWLNVTLDDLDPEPITKPQNHLCTQSDL